MTSTSISAGVLLRVGTCQQPGSNCATRLAGRTRSSIRVDLAKEVRTAFFAAESFTPERAAAMGEFVTFEAG